MINDSNQRKFGVIFSYLSIIISTVIQLVYTPLLIRMLGQSEYGLYSLINSVIGYLTVLDLGFGNAIVVYTSKYRAQQKYDEEKKLHGMFFIVFCIIAMIVGILGIILYFNVEKMFGKTMTDIEIHKAKIMMLILTFNLVITFIFTIYSSILTAYEKFVYQKVMSILNTILKPVIMIPLLFMGYKSIAMVVVITIVNIAILISNYLYCRNRLNIRIKYRGFDKVVFKTILGYSIWLFLSSIVDKVNWSVDQFVLGAVSGTIAVSIYSIASQINTLFINLSTAISGVFLPKMSKMISNDASSEVLTNEFIKVGRIQFYIMFLITSGFVVFGKEFIILWAGREYIESYYVTLCLILPALFSLIQNLGLSIMQAMNKFRFKAIITTIMSGFNIIISIFLSKRFGAIGAALGTTISLVICNIIIINIYYYKIIKINVIKFWKIIFNMFIKLLCSLIIVLILMQIIKLNGFKFILTFGTIYVILYFIVAYKFVMNQYEKELTNTILKKFIKIKEKK